MNQTLFISARRHRWAQFEVALEHWLHCQRVQDGKLPLLHRQLCRDLTRARQAGFDSHLVEYLNAQVLAGHRALYAPQLWSAAHFWRFWSWEFPRAVRRNAVILQMLGLLFVGSALALWTATQWRPELVFSVLSFEHISQLDYMYGPSASKTLRQGGSESDVAMFGFYIFNNLGICFRSFASGIFFGVGSIAMLLFNGVYFGAVAGYLTHADFTDTFYPFVVAHSAPELTAVLLSSAAGFKLGWALLAPGCLRRMDALRCAGREALPLVYGSAGLLVLAACVEAFWSARDVSVVMKFGVGLGAWLSTVFYFAMGGRSP